MDSSNAMERGWLHSPWFWATGLLVLLLLVRLVSGYDGLYGQDPYAYYNYACDIQAYWRGGPAPGHFVWPRIYPLLGALWPLGDPGPWMQGLSMIAAAVFLGMTIKLLRATLPDARFVAPIAFVCLGLAPFLMRSGLSIMSDVPGLALMSCALWLGQRYLATGRVLQLLLAALFTGLAIWTRYPVALAMALPALFWLLQAFRSRHWGGILLFLPMMLLAAIPHYWVLPQAAEDGIGHAFQNTNFTQWSPAHFFQRDFEQVDGHMHFPEPNLLANLGMFWHPRFLGVGLLGMLGLYLFRKKLRLQDHAWVDWGSVALTALFLSGVPFQNARFLLPMLPFAGKILGPSWVSMLERILQKRWRWVIVGALVAVQLMLALYACRTLMQESRKDRHLAADLAAVPRQDRRLYEFSLQAMLRARHVGFEKASMWDAEIPKPRVGDLVIFNLTAFSEQFAGLTPMRNWEMLQIGHTLVEVQKWEGGWQLYEVQ